MPSSERVAAPLATSLATSVATWLATWFGCGLAPRAPGTVGSIGAVPLHLLLSLTPAPVHVLCVLALSAAGIWAAQRYALASGENDPQRVVIDEVAGTAIAMGCVRAAPVAVQLAALVLFRVFDIWKPWPIRRLEHLRPPGVGIMMDDLLAGVFAGALAYGLWALAT